MSLERRGSLQRGAPLRAKKPLARTGALAPGRRLRPISAKRLAQRDERAKVRARVFARDGGCVLLRLDPGHRCMGPMTPHHLHKAGAGGAYTEENLVSLCAGGNTWVEDHPVRATELGLVWRGRPT